VEAVRLEVVLDTSAVVALFLLEPSAPSVRELIRRGGARMSTVNAAETVDVMARVYGADPSEAVMRVDELLSRVVPVPATADIAAVAGELRARHWQHDRRISLADCFVLATAEPGGRIATLDAQLSGIACDEGYEVVPLA
jgi:PIN domain nuclease of toxin-antitoxin system